MPGYSGTPLWKKLGFKTGMAAYVQGAPAEYQDSLGLPADIQVRWLAAPEAGTPFAHLFTDNAAELKTLLKLWRKKIAPDGVIWISWPKKTSGVATDLTDNVVRELALPTGLVDIKVCAVDDVWSGLKLMVRKELR
jgi:hypothetical protein